MLDRADIGGMKNNNTIIYTKRFGKTWLQYQQLLIMQYMGRGEEKIMFCYPDAPYHIEPETIPIIYDELEGFPQRINKTVEKKVYDYPILTINQAIENYKKHGKFDMNTEERLDRLEKEVEKIIHEQELLAIYIPKLCDLIQKRIELTVKYQREMRGIMKAFNNYLDALTKELLEHFKYHSIRKTKAPKYE